MQDTVDQVPGAIPRTLARHHRGHPGRAVRPVLGAARWAASRTAGQAHSSRSRICCTWLTDSATSRPGECAGAADAPGPHRPAQAGSSAAAQPAG